MVNVVVSAYKSVEVEGNDGNLTVSEGMHVRFCRADSGEVVEGGIVKILGKKDKTKFQIIPNGEVKHEIWTLTDIAAGSIEILTREA